MHIILIILVITVILLVLAGIIINLSFRKRNEAQLLQKSGKKSHTTQLHELLFQRKNHADTLDLNDYE